MPRFNPFSIARNSDRLPSRLLKCTQANVLTSQGDGSCVPDHMSVARAASSFPKTSSWQRLSKNIPSESAVKEALEEQPCVLIASGIAQEGSRYVGHHAITLLCMVNDTDVLLIDRDNTIENNEFVYTAPLRDLLDHAKVPMNENLDGEPTQVDDALLQPGEGPGCIMM